MRRARAIPWLVLAALAVVASPAQAADFIVNTTADTSTDGFCTPAVGGCSLRDAVTEAGPTDIVRVPPGTYGLTQNRLTLVGDTIVGAGARTTIIDGGGTSNVFYVPTTGNQISGVTITNGQGGTQMSSAGGGILVAGSSTAASLTLTNSTVSGNSAPAGGGIASNGTLSVVGSTVSGNLAMSGGAPSGGGIFVAGGTTTLRNSTVSGNTATDQDGSESQGGGIHVETGGLLTQSVTIARNQADAGGGLYRATGTVATISHTIIADNPLGGACGGTMTPLTADHNIADDATCTFAGSPREPLLGLLLNNGGPTNTHALAPTSPAVNTGTSCPATDQRGVARQGACDIGAFEFVPPAVPPTSDQELPPPVVGKLVNAEPKAGTVRVKLPGRRRFRRLTEGVQLPVGTTVDTRNGRISLTAAQNKRGGTASADFFDGLFKLTQSKGRRPITTLRLVEKLSCAASGKASAAAKRKKKRRLWGKGKGRFRTDGKYSAATVVGTTWLVEDRCTSTLTRVKRGRVSVRDEVLRKTVIVRRGKRYIARAEN